MRRGLLAAAAGLGLIAGGAQAATGCNLRTLAELPITTVAARPTVPASINGHGAPFFIDSGASFGTIARPWAKRLDVHEMIAPGYYLKGVGGEQTLRYSRVDRFSLANIPLEHIDFFVAEGGIEPSIAGVVGENILGAFDTEYDLANGVIRLFRPEGCGGADLGYWAGGKANVLTIEDTERDKRHIVTDVTVNGQRMRALWDTGAPRTVLNKRSAARAGVTPASEGVQYAGRISGFGYKSSDSWVGAFASFAVGDEKILNTRLPFMDADAGEHDMLLGLDFFLSHRILVSNSQRKLYFTYNGGPVFTLDMAQVAARKARERAQQPPSGPVLAVAGDAAATPAPADPNEPKDAAGYVRRAAASRARLDYPAAIADLTKAIELVPNDPEHYLQRAQVFAASGQALRAMADYSDVLTRKPDSVPALMGRGALYAGARDMDRARADLNAAMKAAPDNSTLPLSVAAVYSAAGFHQDAQALYDRWLMDHPRPDRLAENSPVLAQQVAALNGACWSRAVLNRDLDTALADCDAGLKLRPKGPGLLDSRGFVHLRKGEYDLAIADYDAALKLEPKAANSLYARGVAKVRKGATAEGKADEQAALALNAHIADQARRNGLDDGAAPAAANR